MLNDMQERANQNEWPLFCRHYFEQCAEVNPELATKIASLDVRYETDRWFNSYARALKRARKLNATGLVLHCAEDFQLPFKAVSNEETLWTEQEGYKFHTCDDLRKIDSGEEVMQWLWARVAGCFVDMIIRKKAQDLSMGIDFHGLDGRLHLPSQLRSAKPLAESFVFEEMDTMKGASQTLEEAVAAGDLAELKKLLDEGADINTQCFDGQNLLACALDHQNPEIASFVMEQGIDIDPENASMTPLEAAIETGAAEIIDLLLKRGVDLNRKGSTAEGYPLHRLAWGYLDPGLFRDFLAAGADPSLLNADGRTALQVAKDGLPDNPDHQDVILAIIAILSP